MHKYKKYFDNIKGYFFPLLIVKRQEGVTFKDTESEMYYDKTVLDSIGETSKSKLIKHYIESYGLWNTVKFLWAIMNK
jgi:hypothetical protein